MNLIEKFNAQKNTISLGLLALLGFTMPLGSGLNMVTGLPFSKLFPAALILFIVYVLLFEPKSIRRTSLGFNLFIIFSFIHILVFYWFVIPEKLTASYAEQGTEGSTILGHISKYLLFVAMSYAVAFGINTMKKLQVFILAYTVAFILTLLFSIGVSFDGELFSLFYYRISGGYENPNSFAASGLIVIVLNTLCFLRADVDYRKYHKISMIIGFAGVAFSQSRGLFLGIVVSSVILWFLIPSSERNYRKDFLKIFAVYVFLFLTSGYVFTSLHKFSYKGSEKITERANIVKRIQTQQESRINIWGDYYKNIDEFWAYGVGKGNVKHITKYTYTTTYHYDTHNRYLNVFAEFGILGLLVFLFFIFNELRKNYNWFRSDRSLFSLVFLCFALAWSMIMFFEDFSNSRDLHLFFGLLMVVPFLVRPVAVKE